MLVTLVATMCHMIVAQPTIAPDAGCTAEEAQIDEIVTDNSITPELSCMNPMLMVSLADWKTKHPVYHREGWRIGRHKCVVGPYSPPRST